MTPQKNNTKTKTKKTDHTLSSSLIAIAHETETKRKQSLSRPFSGFNPSNLPPRWTSFQTRAFVTKPTTQSRREGRRHAQATPLGRNCGEWGKKRTNCIGTRTGTIGEEQGPRSPQKKQKNQANGGMEVWRVRTSLLTCFPTLPSSLRPEPVQFYSDDDDDAFLNPISLSLAWTCFVPEPIPNLTARLP